MKSVQQQYEQILNSIPKVMKYKDHGSRIPLLQQVLDAAGANDKKFQTIHVCGTNGKGSTSRLIGDLLRKTGYKVGVFSSPVMYDEREQVKYDGEMISYADFVDAYQVLRQAFEQLGYVQSQFSLFETWYLLSTIYFASKKADFVVYECGLGGEFDATNATRNIHSAVFTKIAMDHMQILESTIKAIAKTKSKIIKPGIEVFDYPQQTDEVADILKAEAAKQEASFFDSSSNKVDLVESHLTYSIIDVTFAGETSKNLHFNLGGTYQLTNLQNVLNWVAIFNQTSNKKIQFAAVKDVLAHVTLPGRMELIQQDPPVIIDGAHNYNAINALVASLVKYERPIIFVVGFLADKEYQQCVDRLLDLSASFIITSPDNEQRALPAEELLTIFQSNEKADQQELFLADSITKAVEIARQKQQETDATVVFAGSFYLINHIKPNWNKK